MAKTFQQKEEELKKMPKIAGIVAIVLIVAFLGALFINSNFLRRRATAVEASGVKFSAADVGFFYKNAFTDYTSYAPYLGWSTPTSGVALSSQTNPDTGDTWEYFFSDNAYATMKNIAAIYAEAQRTGFALTAEQEAEFDAQIAADEEQIISGGVAKSLAEYVKLAYGNTINKADYLRLRHLSYVVEKYSQFVNDGFDITAADKLAYYNENKDDLDTYAYRVFTIKAETPETTAEDTTEEDTTTEDTAAEDTEAAQKAAIEAAQTKAEEYIAAIGNETEFIGAAREYDAVTYAEDDSTLNYSLGQSLSSVYGDWLKSAGDGASKWFPASEEETNDTFYVVMLIGRSDNNYVTKSYREMVLAMPEVERGELDDDAYNAAIEKAQTELAEKAQRLLDEVKTAAAAGTAEEKLIELTEDVFNEATGGEYENVEQHRSGIIKEMNDWLFGDAAANGIYDYKDANGAFHIVLFLGDGDVYRDSLADTKLRSDAYTAWQEQFNEADGRITFWYRLRTTAI